MRISNKDIVMDAKQLKLDDHQLMQKYQLNHKQLVFVLGNLADKKHISSIRMISVVKGFLNDGELGKAQECLKVIKNYYPMASGVKSLARRVEAEVLVHGFLKEYEKEKQMPSKLLNELISNHPDIERHPEIDRILRNECEYEYKQRMQRSSPTINWFRSEFPHVTIHPEIEHMVKILETAERMRTIEKLQLTERIKRVSEMPVRYLGDANSDHAKRMWHFTVLQMAIEEGVRKYRVVSQCDKKTCDVCFQLHARSFSVSSTYKKVKRHLEAGRSSEEIANKLAAAFPFPRVQDVDNKTIDEIQAMALLPPFCDECRCQVVFWM